MLQELLSLFLGFLLLERGVEPTRVESPGGAVTELVSSGGEILTRTGSNKIGLSECSVDTSKVNLAMRKIRGKSIKEVGKNKSYYNY